MGFAQERFKFSRPPKLFFKQDQENAKNVLGKTAFYNPQQQSITLFTTNRHPKDILRTLAHELVHHTQNLRGDFNSSSSAKFGLGYAQENPDLRELEREAYEQGNLCFRDWEDGYKKQLQEVKFLKESKKMTQKITKKTLQSLIRKVLKETRLKEEKPVSTPLASTNRDPFEPMVTTGQALDDSPQIMRKREKLIQALQRLRLQGPITKAQAIKLPHYEELLANKINSFLKFAKKYAKQDDRYNRVPHVAAGVSKVLIDPDPDASFDPENAAPHGAPQNYFDDPLTNVPTVPVADKEIKRKGIQQKKFLKRIGVRSMNQLRKLVGMKNIPAEGTIEADRYDKELHDAIKDFQDDVGATSDGVVGPGTVTAAQKMAKTNSFYNQWKSLRGKRTRRRTSKFDMSGFAQALAPARALARESIDPLGEGSGCGGVGKRDDLDEMGCGGKGKRDDAEKQVLDESEKEQLKKQIDDRTKRLEAAQSRDENDQDKRRIASLKRAIAKDKQALAKLENVNEGKSEKCEKCKNCKCPGGGQACDKCKNCKCDEKDSEKKDSKEKSGKGGFPDLTGDNKVTQADILKGRGVKLAEGSKIYTPEQEQTLYESRFNDRNEQIFDKLKKLWTK